MSKWDLQSWINKIYFFGKAPLPTKVALIVSYACMSTQADRQRGRQIERQTDRKTAKQKADTRCYTHMYKNPW